MYKWNTCLCPNRSRDESFPLISRFPTKYLEIKCIKMVQTAGLDISDCPVPVKTDVGQVDLVLRLSDGTSEKIRDSQTCRYDGQIYFH